MAIRKPIVRETAFQDADAVTPSDVATVQDFDGIMVTVAGNVAVEMLGGNVVTLPGLQPGVIYPIAGVRVMATGTSATGIVVLR